MPGSRPPKLKPTAPHQLIRIRSHVARRAHHRAFHSPLVVSAGALVWPVLLVLIAAAILAVTPHRHRPGTRGQNRPATLMTVIGTITFLLRLIDFRADYFIITNKTPDPPRVRVAPFPSNW